MKVTKELERSRASVARIGPMKNDGFLERCYLKGQDSDAMDVLRVACDHNLREILVEPQTRTVSVQPLSPARTMSAV